MREHVKEPWKTAYRINPRTQMYAQEIFDENGETIATLSWYPVKKNDHMTATNREANARRIVACVNRCSGISTEDLEDGNVSIVRRDPIALTPDRDTLETPE